MIKHSSVVNHSYLSLSHIKRRPQKTPLMICGKTLPSVNACFVTKKKEVINYIALLPFMLCHIDEPESFTHMKVHFSAYRLSTVEWHHISSIMICLMVTAGTHTNTDFLSLSSAAQGTAKSTVQHTTANFNRSKMCRLARSHQCWYTDMIGKTPTQPQLVEILFFVISI